jgi:hypothetical protein
MMSELDVELGGVRAEPAVPPPGHPLVAIAAVLADPDLYPSTLATPLPPPVLVRAMTLHALYRLGPDLLAAEQLTYNRLFRWFLGPGWRPEAYVTSREQLLAASGEDNPFARAVLLLTQAGLWHQPPFEPDEDLMEAWTGTYLLVFEDLVHLDNRSLQRLLREVEMAPLALALAGAPEALLEHILANLSRRMGEILEQEIGYLAAPDTGSILEARAWLLAVVRQLVRAGEVNRPRLPGP